jgi:acid phosphatase type 7
VLYVGDLSYADNHPLHDNTRWDSWARFVERSAAHQPWVWTAGNHELDLAPELGENVPFKPFAHRYPTPFWYSVRVASAHVVVLASYSAYGKYTAQWEWLRAELARVDRAATPWLIVLVHSPWYSSNGYHYMEGETMRVQFERSSSPATSTRTSAATACPTSPTISSTPGARPSGQGTRPSTSR